MHENTSLRDPQRPPLDYVEEEDIAPFSARPMFRPVELVLLGSLFAVAIVCFWIGFTWGQP